MSENIEEAKIMAYSLAAPTIKEMLLAIAKYTNNDTTEIDSLYIDDNIGSFKIDNVNNKAAHIMLKTCDKNHDLNAEFNKLKPYINSDHWKQVLNWMSSLVLLVRSIYKQIYVSQFNFGSEFDHLEVDMDNTTLYVPNIDIRIGIFIEIV
jgi:hypothetical protein